MSVVTCPCAALIAEKTTVTVVEAPGSSVPGTFQLNELGAVASTLGEALTNESTVSS